MSGIIQAPDSATRALSGGGEAVFNVGYGYYPQEGSRAVTTQYNWITIASYAEDGSQLVAKGVETTIQSLYVDNSGNTQGVQIIIAGTGQVINCPASSQGVFPAFFTGIPSFTISSVLAGVPTPIAATTRLCLLNFPVSPAVWHI